MPGRSSFGRWNKSGEFEWRDREMPVGPRRARMANLPQNLRLYTVREVAVVLRHSIYWVRDQIKAGRIRALKLGSGYFITVIELARIMGETGFRRGGPQICWNGSENFGKRIPKPRRRKSPVTSTPGSDTSKATSTAPAADSSPAPSSTVPRTPSRNKPLITSPGY